ncbi:nucleolar complex-associated protein [Colletotrichum phormii]|uniref:Nucleolar complex-associated protein 3 n=1 Tax=Colletotrichum phormii TaxID=359342 RepID=A0AAI9ZYD2_9PEZI|nr:nucleolar complex-associated protein [Colletotrichum phormii]KAK1640520.1 nucleolar complex-associated protein [Colletotrichum phormii]
MSSRASKRRRLTPPPEDENDHTSKSSKKIQKSFFKNAASWNLEQDYENRPRKGKKDKKESTRLPIKTADGRLEQYRSLQGDDNNDDADSVVGSDGEWLEGREDEEATAEAGAERLRQDRRKEEEESDLPEPVQIHQAKEELAKIAMALNEDPEENVAAFKAIAKIGQSRIPAIQKLTLATQLAVYKDVIPGYRIRPVAEDAPVEKLSKEVRKLRAFEQALVSGYQGYVKELAKWAKADIPTTRKTGQSISSVAISCACTLVNAVPHFNFRNDLLKILVSKLSKRKIDADFHKCRRALETLFVDDEEGRPSMEAASLLTKMMKARNFAVDETVLNLFLHLRLLSEFAGKASQDRVDRERDPSAPPPQSRKNFKKEFRTKKERKMLKEQRAIQKDMEQADALVSHEERERMQSETLKLVFVSYFRILKMRVPWLMGAVLEGLAKYAHLINQDFFGDLLEALKDLIRHAQEDAEGNNRDDDDDDEENQDEEGDDDDDLGGASRNTSREALLCTVTAFALLAGQDAHNSRSALHLDLSHFVTHLFTSLPSLSLNPDLELTSKSLHIRPAQAAATRDNRVNLQTTTVLLLRCLTAVLLPAYQIRSVPPLRLAAFSKQIMSAALHMPDKSAQAALALMQDVGHTHGKKIAALWCTEERKGDGNYNALSDSVEGSNPFATTVWEGELLRRHFSPKVREGVKLLEKEINSA